MIDPTRSWQHDFFWNASQWLRYKAALRGLNVPNVYGQHDPVLTLVGMLDSEREMKLLCRERFQQLTRPHPPLPR